jgi:hypothetical protein
MFSADCSDTPSVSSLFPPLVNLHRLTFSWFLPIISIDEPSAVLIFERLFGAPSPAPDATAAR